MVMSVVAYREPDRSMVGCVVAYSVPERSMVGCVVAYSVLYLRGVWWSV